MTVSYSHEIATTDRLGVFWKLLFRWKGSVYKLVWPELLIYTFIYALCSLIYRFALTPSGKASFEHVVRYFNSYITMIPVTFVLGFYVSLVVNRWWGQFESIPSPDSLAILISNCIQGKNIRARMLRRTIVRYANLSIILTFRILSPTIKKKFATLENLVEAGFLLDKEKISLEDITKATNGNIFWVPLVWTLSLLQTARRENYITNDNSVNAVVAEINRLRGNCGKLLSYSSISIPLVYTQVVTLAVYSYLLASIMGQQFLESNNASINSLDLYVPLLTYLQITFYLGWLKVAESLVNPFGKDDEDFDVDAIINRNMKISYLIADKMFDAQSELHQDKHWDEEFHKQTVIKTLSESQGKTNDELNTSNTTNINMDIK